MLTIFEVKVRYVKPDERSGKDKKVTEAYLFDALTYTEAEERVYKEMPEYISGEFAIASIRKAKYAEILPSEDGDRWYKVKVSFLWVDETSGREKRLSQIILVLASDVKDAVDKTIAGMGGEGDESFEVNMVTETQIMDFFPLFDKDKAPEDKEISRRPATEEEKANLPKLEE